jgi:PAS domain S-box-containing protein
VGDHRCATAEGGVTAVRAVVPAEDDPQRRQAELEESFVDFIEVNYPKIELFLLRQSTDRPLVEVVLQEALITAMAHWARVSQHDKPLYWVRKTAWHKLMNLLDGRKSADTARPEPPVATPTTPQEARELLVRLPRRQRSVLALAADGVADHDIAKQLDLAVTTVRTYKSQRADLDDLLALAAQEEPTPLERARARRSMRRTQEEYRRRLLDGPEITSDVELHDPLTAEPGEARRITRAAELRKRGSISWEADGHALDWSDEMSRIFGLAPIEAQKSLRAVFAQIHPGDRARVRRQVHRAWRTESQTEVTARVVRRDQATSHVHCYFEVVTDGTGRATGIIATAQDVTEGEKLRREQVRRVIRAGSVQQDLSEADPVTGLLGRRAFVDEVGRALRAGTGTLLVISAPPYIRRTSDTDSGRDDRLRAAAAAVIRRVAGPTDPCGQLSRHEFGVLMQYTTFDTAVPIAEKILDQLRGDRFVASAGRLDAFGGLVHFDCLHPLPSIELLLDAETAWRRAKRADQPLHVLREPPSAAQRSETSRADIRAAVAGSRFALYAQPLRDLELNRITRHEILLRVLDEVGRPTPPATFLEVAEHMDEILPVDKWVIDHALRLIGEGSQTSHYQVNISGRSLADPLLLDHLSSAVERFGVDPERLTVEITETAAIGNLTVARRFADGVRALGCQIALDDFGTGNTPLSLLTQLPIDLVKIDGSFIHDLPRSEPLQAVVQGLVQTCRKLGILTAAEYVQDDATLDLLRGYGVDFAQGYYIGEPAQIIAEPREPQSIELELFPPADR